MDLLKHIANHHHKDEIEVEENVLEEVATINNKNINKNLSEDNLEEDDQLEHLEAELNSLKTELRLK